MNHAVHSMYIFMSTDQPLKCTVSVHHNQMHSQLDTTTDDSIHSGPSSSQTALPHRGVCTPDGEEHSNQQSKPDKILPSLGKGKFPKYVGQSSYLQKESRTLNDPPGTCVWCFLSCERVNPNLTVASSNAHAHADQIMCISKITFAYIHYCT